MENFRPRFFDASCIHNQPDVVNSIHLRPGLGKAMSPTWALYGSIGTKKNGG